MMVRSLSLVVPYRDKLRFCHRFGGTMAVCRTAPFLGFPNIQQRSVSSLPLSGSLEQGLSLTTWLHDTSYRRIARLPRDWQLPCFPKGERNGI